MHHVQRINTSLQSLCKYHPSVESLHSLDTALQGLSLCEMLWEFVAAGAELEGLLHLLKQLLVVTERDSLSLSLNGSPFGNQTHYDNMFKDLLVTQL